MPKFMLPDGVEIPEGLKGGDRFQVVATLVLGDGGKAELVEVDGAPIAGYEGKGKKDEEGVAHEASEGQGEDGTAPKPEKRGFIEAVMARRGGGMMS